MLNALFSQLYFGPSLNTMQRELPAIAGLLVTYYFGGVLAPQKHGLRWQWENGVNVGVLACRHKVCGRSGDERRCDVGVRLDHTHVVACSSTL